VAINGFIIGFADGTNSARHLALIGSGVAYYLIRHGRAVCRVPVLESAIAKFEDEAGIVCSDNWRKITGTKTDSLGNTSVTSLGSDTYAGLTQKQ